MQKWCEWTSLLVQQPKQQSRLQNYVLDHPLWFYNHHCFNVCRFSSTSRTIAWVRSANDVFVLVAVGAARNCFYLMTLCANRKWKLAYCHALHLYPLGAHFVECRHCCCQSLLQYPQLEGTAPTCSSHLCSLYQLLLVPQIRPCFVRHSTVRHCRQGGVQRWRVTWPCSKHLIIIMNACICQAVN